MDNFIVDEIKMRGIYEKGQIIEGVIERVDFPNKGIIRTEDGRQVIVKNTITGTESVCFHQ